MFTIVADDVLCFNQVETIQHYFPVFDKLKKEFFVGELIWNFADFMTKQREIFLLLIAALSSYLVDCEQSLLLENPWGRTQRSTQHK